MDHERAPTYFHHMIDGKRHTYRRYDDEDVDFSPIKMYDIMASI
jgi:hypothetical protein